MTIARFPDRRFVYGARCAWFGPIQDIGKQGGLPACPHCGSPLFELSTAEAWWSSVDKAEADGRPGYRKFIEWMADKHFFTSEAGARAYQAATGIVVDVSHRGKTS